jgi:hypothetical protein
MATAYQPYDVVTFGGSTYVCILAAPANADITPNSTSYWTLTASKGDTGATGYTGSASTVSGPSGPQGPSGYTGSGGSGSTGYTGSAGASGSVETIYAIGTTSGTVTPSYSNGTVQTITLNGNLTLSSFTGSTGQSLTLIITQDATGGRTLTSTMKFAGGSKVLSLTGAAVDFLTIFYDGTTYWASLNKGFA